MFPDKKATEAIKSQPLLRISAVICGAIALLWLMSASADVPYRVVRTIPHDPQAFTQGLAYGDGYLYESTGLYGKSTIRQIDPASGEIVQQRALPAQLFGEGITLWQSTLVQLTWRERLGLIWDQASFEPLSTFDYRGEGWGITEDGSHWIVSDGSAHLRWLHPTTHQVIEQRLVTTADSQPVDQLNELELIEGEIWANLWNTDRIARIDPASGRCIEQLDFSELWPVAERPPGVDVMNGIAYDPQRREIYLTGKFWPLIYVIKFRDD